MKRLTDKDWAELRRVSRALRDADAGTVGLTIPASGLAELFDELETLKAKGPDFVKVARADFDGSFLYTEWHAPLPNFGRVDLYAIGGLPK